MYLFWTVSKEQPTSPTTWFSTYSLAVQTSIWIWSDWTCRSARWQTVSTHLQGQSLSFTTKIWQSLQLAQKHHNRELLPKNTHLFDYNYSIKTVINYFHILTPKFNLAFPLIISLCLVAVWQLVLHEYKWMNEWTNEWLLKTRVFCWGQQRQWLLLLQRLINLHFTLLIPFALVSLVAAISIGLITLMPNNPKNAVFRIWLHPRCKFL